MTIYNLKKLHLSVSKSLASSEALNELLINLMNTNYWMKYVVVRPIFKKRSAESLRNYEKVRNFAAELTQWKNLAACDHLKKC